jgi:uncharacterized membrane protein
MHCPNCKKILREQELVKKPRPAQRGFVLSHSALFCPKCNAELGYPARQLFFSVLGFITFVVVGIANLTMGFPKAMQIILIILSSIAMLASGYYRIHHLHLKLVERKT